MNDKPHLIALCSYNPTLWKILQALIVIKHHFCRSILSPDWSLLVCAPNFHSLIQYEVNIINLTVIFHIIYTPLSVRLSYNLVCKDAITFVRKMDLVKKYKN